MKTVLTKTLPGCQFRKLTKKHKTFVSVLPDGGVNACGLDWDEGSKSSYHYRDCTPGSDKCRSAFGEQLTPPEGWALVETGYFLGKPATPHIWVRAADVPAFLGLVDCPAFTLIAPLVDWLQDNGRNDDAQRVRDLFPC